MSSRRAGIAETGVGMRGEVSRRTALALSLWETKGCEMMPIMTRRAGSTGGEGVRGGVTEG